MQLSDIAAFVAARFPTTPIDVVVQPLAETGGSMSLATLAVGGESASFAFDATDRIEDFKTLITEIVKEFMAPPG